ncbi:UNVERIFIED_CONTAM: hypothetical protein RMT77_009998 [Armadillidium vulgare]
MEEKLHCLLIIYILIDVSRWQYWGVQGQPYPPFHVAPGIESISNPYRELSRSDGTFLTLGSSPTFRTSIPSPLTLKPVRSSSSSIIMPGHMGSGQFPKPTFPDSETGSGSGNYDATEFDKINFPSEKPSRTANIQKLPGYVKETTPKIPVSKKEIKCKIENALIDYRGKCQALLTQGPCSTNQWLLINKEGEAYCAQRPCQKEKLLYNDRCVSISDSSVCGVSEILYVEFSGDVYCDCLPYYVYDSDARRCFAEHDRGSCPFGEYLDLDSNDNLRCVENICKRDDLIYNPENKSCYKKIFKGSCKEEKGYKVVYKDKDRTADCGSVNNRNIFEIQALPSCPGGSKKDHFGNCQRVIVRQDGPEAYKVPTHQVSRHLQCPHGLTIFPDGSCRKPNERFET